MTAPSCRGLWRSPSGLSGSAPAISRANKCSSMSTGQANKSRTGFTLIEIMLAVAILGIMALAIYRFVQSSLTALRVSSEVTASDAAYDGLRDLLSEQWQHLPTGVGALTGDAVKIND